MRLSERTPLVAVLLLSCSVAVGLALWYINVRQDVQTQQALEQTREAFERLEKERANAAEATHSGFDLPGAGATPSIVTPRRATETGTSDRSSGDTRAKSAATSSSGVLGGASSREVYFLLSVLLLTTLIALAVAGSSYRLVQRERRRHIEDESLARTATPEHGPLYRSSPITIIDAEAVKDVTPEEIAPYSEEKPQPRPAPEPAEPWTDLLRHTPSALLIAGTDGEVCDVNEAFRRMTGYAKKDLQSLESWLLKGRRVRPDEMHGALEQLRKSFAMPEAFPVEQTVWTRTGEPCQWLVHCVALASESQETVWALFGTDITDRVNAQYVLRTQMENVQQEAAELASLYQAAPAGLAVLDTQLRFLRVNERMAEMDGIPAAEHAGKSLRKLLPHAASVIEPLLNRVIETAKPSSHLAVRVRTPAEPRTERHWMVSCHPLNDEHGRVTRIEWAVEDVTERHAAETSLRENEAALHVIVDNLPAPLCVKDTQGRYLYANRAYERFTQLGSVPVKGKMDHEIFAWEAADRLRENDDEALAGTAPVHSHGNARFKDAVCYYEAAKIALRDREGKAYGVCALYTDLTDRVHAVSDLEASERRYRAIFESSPQPILIDRDNKLVYVNAACVRLLAAQDAQQLLGKSILEFINPAGHKAFQERVQRALRRKDADQALGLKCTRLDGAELDVELEASLYEAGDERAVQILLRDVTLQRRAEDVVRRSEARFRSVAEETPALIRIADAGGACVYWNRQWHRHTGIAADKALGTAWTNSVHAEDRDRVVHALANVRQQREPLHLEYRLRDRENQYRWMLDIAAPRFDDAGAFLGHVACVTDISERKRAEELLRQGAERLKSIAEQAPVLIWLESTRACEYVNDAFRSFLGAHSAGVMGADWFERIHPDDRDRYAQARREAQKRAAPCETEVRVQRADGEYRRMQVLAAPRLSSEGTLEGYVGSLTDITNLRETEQALQEADRRRDAFIAALADELKAPIGPISTAAEALRMISGSDVRARRASDIIVRQTRHLLRVLEDARDFSQLLEDGIVLAPERAELGELVYRAVEAARPLIETRRQDLNVQMDGGRAQVHADPARLTQAVTELLIYSARSIPEGSRIWLATEEADEEIVLRIRDNGPGLVPEALPALFELFAVREMDGSSGGLGLPLAHHLIELHGGSLDALSDGPGKGLEFVVRLPVFHAGTEQSAQGSNAGALNGAQRVLLVDDDSDSADGLALILQAQGHVVRVSPRASAVPTAREFRPNVVLVDLAAMDNDREQLAHELRALPETTHALLLALGGSSAVQSHHAAEMPFDHYLVKPVESQALQRIFAESAGVLH